MAWRSGSRPERPGGRPVGVLRPQPTGRAPPGRRLADRALQARRAGAAQTAPAWRAGEDLGPPFTGIELGQRRCRGQRQRAAVAEHRAGAMAVRPRWEAPVAHRARASAVASTRQAPGSRTGSKMTSRTRSAARRESNGALRARSRPSVSWVHSPSAAAMALASRHRRSVSALGDRGAAWRPIAAVAGEGGGDVESAQKLASRVVRQKRGQGGSRWMDQYDCIMQVSCQGEIAY